MFSASTSIHENIYSCENVTIGENVWMCMILLGSDWLEAADFMGIWGLISAIAILFNSYNGDVLIAKGRPKISVIIQIIQIVVIIPSVYLSMKVNFTCLSYTRALVRVVGMVLFVITVWKGPICRWRAAGFLQ